MLTRIHVNQHNIKSNKGKPEDLKEPVITVKTYKSNTYMSNAEIVDKDGNIVAKVIYSPDKPLNCGATVWIETDLKVRDPEAPEGVLTDFVIQGQKLQILTFSYDTSLDWIYNYKLANQSPNDHLTVLSVHAPHPTQSGYGWTPVQNNAGGPGDYGWTALVPRSQYEAFTSLYPNYINVDCFAENYIASWVIYG